MKRICTICARGGSKGLPNKNKRLLLGEPLIAYSIIHAYKSRLFDYIVVSSDDDEILSIAKSYGVICVKRPDELASDSSGKLPAIMHAVDYVLDLYDPVFDTLVDLDVTSPLRHYSDIENCVDILERQKVSNVISVTPSHRNPAFNLAKVENGYLSLYTQSDIVRRQDVPPTYDLNASVYCWDMNKFRKNPKLFYPDTLPYVMPKERSFDIDDITDFGIVELIMKNRMN